MALAGARLRVHPHDPPVELEENLWRVEGAVPGAPLRRVMTLVRLADRRVVVHSAIALDEASMARLQAWGRPSILLVPNGFHRLDAPTYLSRFPELTVYCPRAARRRVAQVVRVDGDFSECQLGAGVELGHLDGTGEAEGYVLVRHGATVTLVLNDAVFNMPHAPGVLGFVLRHVTRSSGGPTVSRVARWALVRDRERFRAHLLRLAQTPDLARIIVSHHAVIDASPRAVLERVAAAL